MCKVKQNMVISKSLTQTLKKSELTGLVIDNSEVILDAAYNNEIIKAIPVFSDIYKVYSVVSTVRTSLFQKQMYAFLYELKDLPQQKREKLIKKLESKKGFSHSFGEELIVMLDQFTNVRKSSILARFFLKLLQDEIDVVTFRRLAHILNNIFDGDIDALLGFYNGDNLHQLSKNALSNLGLITVFGRTTKFSREIGGLNGAKYSSPKKNELGDLFVEMMQ